VVAFVERAVDFARTQGREKALRAFMDRQGAFVSGELYIFAYNFDGTVISHGGQAHLVGKNLMDMKDANGVPVITELAKLAGTGAAGCITSGRTPGQNAVVPKLGYVRRWTTRGFSVQARTGSRPSRRSPMTNCWEKTSSARSGPTCGWAGWTR
jgi:hypothetical protein